MKASPSILDFANLVERKLWVSRSKLERSVDNACTAADLKSPGRPDKVMQSILQRVSEVGEADIVSVLTELDNINDEGNLDPDLLIWVTRSLLRDHIEEIEAFIRFNEKLRFLSRSAKAESFAQMRNNVDFYLRQYQAGLFQPPNEFGKLQLNNKIRIREMSGGAIQQGTVESSQTNILNNEINVSAALDALTAIESSLEQALGPDDKLSQIQADMSALKAQLERPEVKTGVVREIGRSLRKVMEGVAINVGSKTITDATSKLWIALGIS